MADILTKKERSAMMSKIRSTNTKPEVLIRKNLHGLGFRYRKNQKTIEGHPDIVLKKYNALIFIHGCFWHGHDCPLYRLPKTNRKFWKKKIDVNRKRDEVVITKLADSEWRTMIVWECAIRGKKEKEVLREISKIAKWICPNKLQN